MWLTEGFWTSPSECFLKTLPNTYEINPKNLGNLTTWHDTLLGQGTGQKMGQPSPAPALPERLLLLPTTYLATTSQKCATLICANHEHSTLVRDSDFLSYQLILIMAIKRHLDSKVDLQPRGKCACLIIRTIITATSPFCVLFPCMHVVANCFMHIHITMLFKFWSIGYKTKLSFF